tara:strand:+ start:34306 stop:34641 length:336 start_codon:yes stop_codon:yes gene_type:complete
MNLIKRIGLGALCACGVYLLITIVVIPLVYVLNYFLPSPDFADASTVDMIVFAAKMSGALMIGPLIIFCHSELPDRFKLESDVVLDTFGQLLKDTGFMLLMGAIAVSIYFW